MIDRKVEDRLKDACLEEAQGRLEESRLEEARVEEFLPPPAPTRQSKRRWLRNLKKQSIKRRNTCRGGGGGAVAALPLLQHPVLSDSVAA